MEQENRLVQFLEREAAQSYRVVQSVGNRAVVGEFFRLDSEYVHDVLKPIPHLI